MKNKYNFSQVAAIYCAELGIDYPQMEDYLKGIFSDLSVNDYETEIRVKTNTVLKENRSEFFPDFYE